MTPRPRNLVAALLAFMCACSVMLATTAAGVSPSAAPVPAVERVTIPFPQDDGSLTPYTFELGYALVTLIYDTLMWHDKDGEPQPWLAESVRPGADGRTVTIVLADGASWQDGQPVTAEDVAFTFGHMRSHPHPRFTAQLSAIERVDTPNARTAVVSLKHPSPGFLHQPLSDVPILPAHLWRDLPPGKAAPDGLPVGSGPYRLVRYLEDESYRFQANEDYFMGAPAVKFIETPFINDSSKMFSAFELGRADMIPVTLPAEIIERVEGIGVELARGPLYLGTVLMLNLRRPPFDDPEVRRALARALDIGRIAQSVRLATPARRGYLHPASSFAPKEDIPAGGQGTSGFNSLRGLSLEILMPDNDPVKMDAGRQAVSSLRRAGADAQTRRVSRDELSAAVGEDGSAPSFQAAIWSSSPLASYDPDFLRRVFGSDPDIGTFNYSGYKSPQFDQLAERIATTPDPSARQAAVTDALRLIAADVPVVPLLFSEGAFAYRQRRYDGWVFVKGTGILDKRSFTRPAGTGSTPAPAPAEPARNLPEQQTPRGFPLGLVAIGFFATAAAVGVIALIRNRS